MGLYVGEQAYLRSSWNILDGFLVFVSLIDIVVSMAGGAKILGVLRVLRLLRTLRPLRYEPSSRTSFRSHICQPSSTYNHLPLQGDQQSSGSEAGGGDAHHVPQAHRQHRPHLLRLLHYLWHSWCPGGRKSRDKPVLLQCIYFGLECSLSSPQNTSCHFDYIQSPLHNNYT